MNCCPRRRIGSIDIEIHPAFSRQNDTVICSQAALFDERYFFQAAAIVHVCTLSKIAMSAGTVEEIFAIADQRIHQEIFLEELIGRR